MVTHKNRDLNTKKNKNQLETYCIENQIPVHNPVGGIHLSRKDEWEEFERSKAFSASPKFDLGIVFTEIELKQFFFFNILENICNFGYLIPSNII